MAKSDDLGFPCHAYAARRTFRAVSNFFNARMKLLDLNAAQVGMLASVARLPGRWLSAIGASVLL